MRRNTRNSQLQIFHENIRHFKENFTEENFTEENFRSKKIIIEENLPPAAKNSKKMLKSSENCEKNDQILT